MDKNTPSDNRGQKSQNSNIAGADNPTRSGNPGLGEIEREAFEDGRESGLNESGNENRPTRNRGGQEANSEKRAD